MGEHEQVGTDAHTDPGREPSRDAALPHDVPPGAPSPDEVPAPPSRWWRLAVAGLGFALVSAVAVPVTLASGSGHSVTEASPSAPPLPSAVEVALEGGSTVTAPDSVTVTLSNRGAAFHVVAARTEGVGYEPAEATLQGGMTGLGVEDVAQLLVVLRPTCAAGVGVERRPELVLDVRGHDGATRTLRQDLTGSVPELLRGRCDAPLGTGARLAVAPLAPDAPGQLRLRLTASAGRGLLWGDSIESAGGLSFEGLEGEVPLVVAPGDVRVAELRVSVGACGDLARSGDPLALQLRLREEPTGNAEQQGRTLSFAAVGGEPYRRAVAAAVAKACP